MMLEQLYSNEDNISCGVAAMYRRLCFRSNEFKGDPTRDSIRVNWSSLTPLWPEHHPPLMALCHYVKRRCKRSNSNDAESHIDLNTDSDEISDDIEEISPPRGAAGRKKAKHVEKVDRKAKH
ncbi:unnamed protein product [Lactuca saligna]|uniref:Uncharacterized protein n=1 Tax=Lactuca saligna TaxID=75948 RepID=A0AA36EE21_LACSI|nr:unnamed protein product [Lactuca saligna]